MRKKIRNLVSFFFFCVILVFFVPFALANKYYIELNFFPFPYSLEVPLYLLILIIFFVGFIFGFIFKFMKNLF